MRVLACVLLLLVLCWATPVAAASVPPPTTIPTPAAVPGPCIDNTPSGPGDPRTRMCVPSSGWNGDLIVFAHGYVAPGEPLAVPDPIIGSAPLSALIQTLGYAYATTSYRRNGLVVLEGIEDVRALIAAFPAVTQKVPAHTYLLGFSEGALISTLLAERSRTLVSGVIAGCGPIGDFRQQTEYFGDFRVLFDYFFPGKLPPSAIAIPQSAIDTWASTYAPAIGAAVAAAPNTAAQLIATSGAATDLGNPKTVISTTLDLLWYNVFSTNDAAAQLGGNPFGNRSRVYGGSANDTALNAGVARFDASAAALASIDAYQTRGWPQVPLVVLHTTLDPIVPFAQFTRYQAKVQAQHSPNVSFVPVERYGHCTFTSGEILAAFNALLQRVATPRPQIYVPVAAIQP